MTQLSMDMQEAEELLTEPGMVPLTVNLGHPDRPPGAEFVAVKVEPGQELVRRDENGEELVYSSEE